MMENTVLALGRGIDGSACATEPTRASINQAMPSSIMAAWVAMAKIGSGLRLKGSSAETKSKRAAWLDEAAWERRDQIGA